MYDPLGIKRHENIAAYVISMWHLEDLVRANGFDIEAIQALLVDPAAPDEETAEEIRDWYVNFMESMKEQGVAEHGHVGEVQEVLAELEFLHRSLVEVVNDPEYDRLNQLAEPGIKALQEKAGGEADGPVETCFTAIYGVMMLRAQDKQISEGTLEAETHMRRLLERLSMHYSQMRKLPGVSMN